MPLFRQIAKVQLESKFFRETWRPWNQPLNGFWVREKLDISRLKWHPQGHICFKSVGGQGTEVTRVQLLVLLDQKLVIWDNQTILHAGRLNNYKYTFYISYEYTLYWYTYVWLSPSNDHNRQYSWLEIRIYAVIRIDSIYFRFIQKDF